MDSPASDTLELDNTGPSQATSFDTPQVDDSPDPIDQTSPINDDDTDQPHKPASAPMQKRRRVTRACDECRRKKIKCDGKQPCTHCTVYSYECTYDQPSNRRRNAAPQYIEALETQLKRAKALLHLVLPSINLNDPNIDIHLQNGILPQIPMGVGPRPLQTPHDSRTPHHRDDPSREEASDHLESMVKATGQLDLDEDGNWDYHGHSSGLSFMRRIQQQFGDIIAPTEGASPFVKYRPMSQVFDSPKSAQDSPADSSTLALTGTDLPPKKEARILCDNALVDAGALMRVVHIPSFYKSMDRIYDVPAENYGNAENQFLPLLYAVLALGTLFSRSAAELDQLGYESAIDEGFKYFKASRQLLDIADCRDLVSLQAIVFMIQFLQSSAKLSTCYAYVGVALRSALRMGLHRSFNVNFSPIEAETRKRVFWTVRKMDTYVGALLGLPHFLDEEDIDQDWPTEVDDEYITETEILPMPEGKISIIAGANAHTRIVAILAKICKYVYPINGTQSEGKNSVTYSVSYAKIREIEQDLQRWLEELPMALKPGGEAPYIIVRVQQLLRMAFGHAQLLLYRPFLHYVSQTYQTKTADQRAFACASACISVSRNIIHIAIEMKKKGLLIGAYWFSMYTTFFAIVSIVYFVLENPDNPTSAELFRDALEGKEALAQFAKRSMAADRCTATLNTIFERLPEKVKRGGDFEPTKKRRQGSSPQSLQSRPSLFKQDPDFIAPGPRRASTFPESMPASKSTSNTHSLPLSQTHIANLGLDSPYGQSPSASSSDFFDSTGGLTPASTTTSSLSGFGFPPSQTPLQRPAQSFPPTPLATSFIDPGNMNVPVSDMSAMMFQSTDPFAYPNQPMTTFENNNHGFQPKTSSPSMSNIGFSAGGMDMKPHAASFGHNSVPKSIPMGHRAMHPNDNDVQLFGPMPMYLMQNAQLAAQRGFQAQPSPHNLHIRPESGNVAFEDLFGGEEWANTFMDPGLGLSGNGSGYGGSNSGGAGGMGMGNWGR
ncbi:fungal-specific transcription factor domain-domain-containing protein [Clohesyomyces aquaticus]|uniref:Fungal-specific transcription factor domain-domain-containing protein n=1 Tax=Clohesyomyces aquaticus TaxID=1231657 RepID=A0A1Y1ZR93_9PLEO|nr:fungal-specific transcription factor domain-domain-containing protein [Clohesyomyces aquaticus]